MRLPVIVQAHFLEIEEKMKVKYCIAEVPVCLESDFELIENSESALFREESCEKGGIICCLKLTDDIPEVEGRFITEALDTKLYQSEKNIYLETFDRKDNEPMILSRFSKDEDMHVEVWSLASKLPHTARIQALWSSIDLPYQLLKNGVLTMHSSVVDVENGAIMFFASSGTGKSTQAALWNKHRNARILNGDKTAISCKNGIAKAYGMPFCGTSEICVNFNLPVRTMVLLGQAKENRITRLTGIIAVKAILDNCFGHQAVEGCVEKMIEIIGNILKTTPIYFLECTPDENAVKCLEEQLRKDDRYGDFVLPVD